MQIDSEVKNASNYRKGSERVGLEGTNYRYIFLITWVVWDPGPRSLQESSEPTPQKPIAHSGIYSAPPPVKGPL